MVKYVFHIAVFGITFFIGLSVLRSFPVVSPQDNSVTHKERITRTPTPTGYFPVVTNSSDPVVDGAATPVCHDKHILPAWNLLKKDIDFRSRFGDSNESPDCSKMLEIRTVDLNGDGVKEILLRGANFQLCSAVGNCGLWVFQKTGKGYRKILVWSDYVDITEMGGQVEKSKTNGYHDILLKAHIDASNTSYDYFSFNGQKYSRSKCMVDAYLPGSSPDPKWKMVSCKYFEHNYENR